MHPYPHLYTVEPSATPEGDVPVTSAGLPALTTAPLTRITFARVKSWKLMVGQRKKGITPHTVNELFEDE